MTGTEVLAGLVSRHALERLVNRPRRLGVVDGDAIGPRQLRQRAVASRRAGAVADDGGDLPLPVEGAASAAVATFSKVRVADREDGGAAADQAEPGKPFGL